MKFIATMLAVLGMALSFTILPAVPALAYDIVPNDVCNDASGVNGQPTACTEDTPGRDRLFGSGGVFELVTNILALIAGVAAIIVIIIAGIQYMLSTGDPTKTNNAKNAFIYALVGLVVVVVARYIVLIILGRLA